MMGRAGFRRPARFFPDAEAGLAVGRGAIRTGNRHVEQTQRDAKLCVGMDHVIYYHAARHAGLDIS